jgi:hypothetical protein
VYGAHGVEGLQVEAVPLPELAEHLARIAGARMTTEAARQDGFGAE